MKHTKCLVCNSEAIAPLRKYYGPCGLVKCKNCSFVFIEKIPSAEELDAFYSHYSYSSAGYLSPLTIKSYNALLDEFEKYRKTNKILDVGCGRGWFIDEAKKRGWEVYGTEYSTKAIEICEAKGINMKQGQLDSSVFDSRDFDVVTSFEVIEHINNPREELKNISDLLRTGGLFYCTTPNFDSIMRYYLGTTYNVINYPEHLSYYTKRTLKRLCKAHGLTCVKFLSTGISMTRVKTSKAAGSEKIIAKDSSDEKLRTQLDQKAHLRLLKSAANSALTLTNLGMNLKGYFVKN